MNNLSLEQFGAEVRLKYPAYRKYSNKEIAEKVLARYPQYARNIGDLPKTGPTQNTLPLSMGGQTDIGMPNKGGGFLSAIGKFFSGNTQKFGETVGQTYAAPSVIRAIEDAERLNSETELQLTKKINENKKAGKDTSRLERELVTLQGRQGVREASSIVPALDKTDRQVVGEAVGTGLEALSGGLLRASGVARVAPTAVAQAAERSAFLAKPLTGRLADIGVKTVKNVAQTVPYGYAYDVAQNLQDDKSGASIFKPGAASLVSAVIPLSIGGIQAGRQVTADALSGGLASNFSGVPAGAYKRMKTGDATQYIGKMTPEQALDDARASASAFKSSMYKAFGDGKENIINEFTGKRIGLNEKVGGTLKKIAERFGFDESLPQNLQNMSAKETMDLLENINAIKPATDIDDPLVRSLKFSLGDVKTELMKMATQQFGGEGGSFQKLYSNYARQKGIIKNIQSVIGKVGIKPNSVKLTPVQYQTATRRLQKIFNEDANAYFDAIKTLEQETGQKIIDKVAASQLSKISPKNFRVSVSTVPGVNIASRGVLGLADDIVSVLTFPLSSPRIGAWLIRKIGGYDQSIATKLLNASPSVRKAIYDAVYKENTSFKDAINLFAREIVGNKGLATPQAVVTGAAITGAVAAGLQTENNTEYVADDTNSSEEKFTPSNDSLFTKLREEISYRESRGSENPYMAINSNDDGTTDYGKYQVNEQTLKTYSKQFLGKEVTPEEFLANPDLQERFFEAAMKHLQSKGAKSMNAFLALWHKGWSDVTSKRLQELLKNEDVRAYINTK